VRLVDWGLSFQIPPAADRGTLIPYRTTQYVIQFNVPPTNILYPIITSYENPKEIFENLENNRENIKKFIQDYSESYGEGHRKYIENHLLPEFYPGENRTYYDFLAEYIEGVFRTPAAAAAAGGSAENPEFIGLDEYNLPPNIKSFLTNDYYYVCDLYGILSCFFDIIQAKTDAGEYSAPKSVRNEIRAFFVDYIWKNPRELKPEIIDKYIDRISRAASGARGGENLAARRCAAGAETRKKIKYLRRTVRRFGGAGAAAAAARISFA
jgi:hypothetical protein